MKRICVFAGSNAGARESYLIGALEGGAEVIGVLPRALAAREIAHTGLSEMRIVSSLHERKAMMSALASWFVALPGGCGTMDELFEAITWGQLGLHENPIGLRDVDGYYGPLLSFLEHMNAEGFVRPALRLVRARTARDLLDQLLAAPPAAIGPPGPHPPP